MEYVSLAPGLPPSSRLGFGCGSVMGRIGRSESLRAISGALDAGITHFDAARLYGYGEAESLLGEALRGRRGNVVIASKFGLVAPRAAGALRRLKPVAQKLAGAIPAMRPLIRGVVGTSAREPGRFSPAAAQRSLEQSLAALGTGYLDILFLHEGEPADLSDELVAFLDAQVAAGTIRAWGVASGPEPVGRLVGGHRNHNVFQFGNSMLLRNADRLPPARRRYVGHSPFFGAERLISLLKSRPGLVRLPDGRPIEPPQVYPLMLEYALAAESIGVVLCSMLNEVHLEANLAAVERPGFSQEEIAAVTGAVADLLPAPAG